MFYTAVRIVLYILTSVYLHSFLILPYSTSPFCYYRLVYIPDKKYTCTTSCKLNHHITSHCLHILPLPFFTSYFHLCSFQLYHVPFAHCRSIPFCSVGIVHVVFFLSAFSTIYYLILSFYFSSILLSPYLFICHLFPY